MSPMCDWIMPHVALSLCCMAGKLGLPRGSDQKPGRLSTLIHAPSRESCM